MSQETNITTREIIKDVPFAYGQVEYSVISGDANMKPIIVIPGFTEGRVVLEPLSQSLNETGRRTVIFSEQPTLEKSKLPVVGQHAEALLAIIENEGLNNTPMDFVAHSFGAMVLVRAAELAQKRGLSVFDNQIGSNAIFIAPAGTNPNENIASLGGRFAKFMVKPSYYGKELDPTGEFMKAGIENFFGDKRKTAREIASLTKKESFYSRLGKLGLKPFVFSYSNDDIYPYRTSESVLQNHSESLSGWATRIDTGVIGAGSFEEFKAKSGLAEKEARRAWTHHYRNASHNDFIFHPERTAKAILQVLGR